MLGARRRGKGRGAVSSNNICVIRSARPTDREQGWDVGPGGDGKGVRTIGDARQRREDGPFTDEHQFH